MTQKLLVEPERFETIDISDAEASGDELAQILPHRGPMAQLDAVLVVDADEDWAVGHKMVDDGAFWTDGHFPSMSVMPGVLMCEVAAQLCGYYAMQHLRPDRTMAFSGIDDASFRSWVSPPSELYVLARLKRMRDPLVHYRTQLIDAGDHAVVYDGVIKGMLKDDL